jgi:hypothetical protein
LAVGRVGYGASDPPASLVGRILELPERPTWYLVGTQDKAIPSDTEGMFATRMGAATIKFLSSHVAMVSRSNEVTQLIKAAESCA